MQNGILGALTTALAPVLAPYVLIIAQVLQLSMGVMAIAEVGVGFQAINTLAQALITAIMTIIALPDSFSWAIKPGTKIGDGYNGAVRYMNERQHKFEEEVMHTSNVVLEQVSERAEHMSEQVSELLKALPSATSGGGDGQSPFYRYYRPLWRAFLQRLDEIGEVVRASPFLLIVIVLDGAIAVNDFTLPDLHQLYHIHAFFFPPHPIPTLWAAGVARPPFSGTVVDAASCSGEAVDGDGGGLFPGHVFESHGADGGHLCSALGAVNETCAASAAWAPRPTQPSPSAAPLEDDDGARLFFEHPLRASYLSVHYQLSPRGRAAWLDGHRSLAPNESAVGEEEGGWRRMLSPATFTIRVALLGNSSVLDDQSDVSMQAEAAQRAYDVHVSVSLVNARDRNVTIVPLSPDAPQVIVGADKKAKPANRLLALPIIRSLVASSVAPSQLSGHAVECPRPLRLRLLANDTRPLTQSAVIWLVGQDSADDAIRVRIAAVQLEGALADDAEFEEEEEIEVEEDEETEGFSLPVEEIISFIAAVSTAAASSEFVRMHGAVAAVLTLGPTAPHPCPSRTP